MLLTEEGGKAKLICLCPGGQGGSRCQLLALERDGPRQEEDLINQCIDRAPTESRALR